MRHHLRSVDPGSEVELCECCEDQPAELDHLAEGRHFHVCRSCYVPNGSPARPLLEVVR